MNAIKRDKTLSKKSQKKPLLKPKPKTNLQPQARRQKMPLKSLLKRLL